ncbi:MAG: ABC transporter [Bacteroidetes bacterium GWC2_33_15]|nr:MAG: ABC transporter [Bacteroidetes bacterium GWA2_33_15]OFX50354.1 MAG: ABC transporter [Bacteroidetes bacterium GWC2_33_15]OFX66729.1 MAG: ABC transporter [Bacteroidetes bacterium GWB2_32_14]OFX69347.1 MAG: ABC transporter [Bacteroidetes bacterium GWD2_33_33]HAN18666.1 ABC transporter [Bacteroidales bacterium]
MFSAGLFFENLRISIKSIRSNLLRTILTVFIIAFGIMALVGILTAIESIKSSISNQFTSMGANTFSIVNRDNRVRIGGDSRPNRYRSIEFREAMSFKEDFNFPAVVSISTFASELATVKYKSEKTNPNITVIGSDENYMLTSGSEIDKGRNFSINEITSNAHVAIIGPELVKDVFAKNEDPLEKIISIGSGKYKVIGVLKAKGSSFGSAGDDVCILPITNVRQYFSRPNMNFRISVLPQSPTLLKAGVNEAEGIFRVIRKLRSFEESNFSVETSDNLANLLIKNIRYVTLAATIIGIITLFGAAIGLMNIMLVSVTERTREIGIRKAIGAKSSLIRRQFLYESVLIGQLGGFFGIILGILIGNLVSLLTGGVFIIPWLWIIGGVVLCFFVGLFSGLIPAIKASKLDPIISLRYE